MRIFRHFTGVPDSARGGVVVLGNFDGIHRGHQAVIGRALALARDMETTAALGTFEPHPRRFFRPDEPPFQLTPLRSKVRHLRSMGLDSLFLMHFDKAFAGIAAEAFVDDIVLDAFGARHVVVGYDFVFGQGRRGNVDMLRALAARRDVAVTALEPQTGPGGVVYSSTRIRDHLRDGEPGAAATLLGRCWEIEGRIVKGFQRGRTIGFPTANILLDDYVEPALGVYAVWAGIEQGENTVWHPGVANIGRRPTFDGESITVETYILDIAEDLYDRTLRVALVKHLRPEKKFDGVEALREQIAADAKAARSLLESTVRDGPSGPPSRVLMAAPATT